MTIKVTLHRLDGAGPKQAAIAARGVELLASALNHEQFQARLRKAEYTATWHRSPAGNNAQASAQQILETIVQGRELGKNADSEIDLHVEFASLRSWVPFRGGPVGITDLGKFPIRTAYWFVNECITKDDAASLAAHFMHEWMHVAGFYHQKQSARGDVAYVIGALVEDILREHFVGPSRSEMM